MNHIDEPAERRPSADAEREWQVRSQNDRAPLPLERLLRLVNELQLKAAELEMENEELLSAQRESEEAFRRYAYLYEFSPAGYFTINSQCFVTEVNLTGLNMLRCNRSLVESNPFSSFVDPADRDIFEEHRSRVIYGRSRDSCDLRMTRTDGSFFHATLESTWEDRGGDLFCRTIVIDATERKQGEEKLMALSMTDELTGLYNRRGFLTLAEQQIRLSNRSGKGFVLLSADLDGLKQINDSFGHAEGDSVLAEVAGILRNTVRESDVVARMGGDEFVILQASEARGEAPTTRLQKNLAACNYRNRPYRISLSVGESYYDPACPVSLHELLARADKAMYSQKKSRKKTFIRR